MSILDDILGDTDNAAPETEDYKPIPKGTYTCELLDASLGTKADVPVVDLIFKIVDGAYENRRLWQTVWFNQPNTDGKKKAMAITLKALDVPKECDSTDWNLFAENVCAHVQKFVEVQKFKVQVFGHREYQSKLYEKSSVQKMFNESEVHKGVENMAPRPEPSFDSDEELPF